MELSREQCQHIKGIAILLIIIHNFVDILLGITSNEMVYTDESTQAFLDHLFTADSIWYIFAYAGWIGVPLFFFLSGYGLTKKYGTEKPLKPGSYITNHLVKLWKLLIPIYLVYFCIYTTNIQSALAHLTFTINILSYGKNGFYMDPGVFWFFGAILQFYLLFILFRKLDTRWCWLICVAFVAFHYYFIYNVDNTTMRWIRNNFLGWGETFILGIIAARSRMEISKRTNIILCAVSFVGICVCLVTKWLAPWLEVCTIIFLVTLARMMTVKWVCFIGVISPSIFALHPLIRQLFYSIFDFAPNYPYTMTIIFVITTILLSWVHHLVLNKTNNMLKTIKN